MPWPFSRSICPSRTPAGMRTSSVRPSGKVMRRVVPLAASRKPTVSV